MRNNRGIRTAQTKGELWDLDAEGPRGTGTRMLISPFSCNPTDLWLLLGHWLPKSSVAGRGWCCATASCPPWGMGCQGHLLWQDSQLGMCWGLGWLQTFLTLLLQETQILVTNARGTFPALQQKLSPWIAALQIATAKCTKPLPRTVSKSSGHAPAIFLGAYSMTSSAFISLSKNTEEMQVLHGLYVNENRTKPRKAVQGEDKSLRLRRRWRNTRHKLGDAVLLLNDWRWEVEGKRGFFPHTPFSRRSSLSLMPRLEVKGLQPHTEANENTNWSKLPFFTNNLFIQQH